MKLRTLTGFIPAPPAGQGLSYTFSPNERVRLCSFLASLTTNNAVANRGIGLNLLDAQNNVVFQSGSNGAQGASTALTYNVSRAFGQGVAMTSTGNEVIGIPFPDLWLPPGWSIQFSASSLQAADQWSGATFCAEYQEDMWDQDREMAMREAALAALITQGS